MEPHPIPQNVTSFQFHLVGDMTLKQFLYLATGSTIAYLLFVFASANYPVVTWPLIFISAGLGFIFAFLPINSRPLDYWVAAFLKAVYSPTKRVWRKNGQIYKDNPLFNSRFITYVSGLAPGIPKQPEATPIPLSPPIPQPMPSPDDLKKTVDLAREAQNLQMKIIQTERQLDQIKTEAQKPTPIPIDYSQQVNKILGDLQSLITQASQIRGQLESIEHPIPPIPVKPKIKVVVPVKPKPTQIALTTFPNIINGIIKDSQGNSLEGVVVVIYDKEGLPVRALKTNKLGQFTGSTPLPNGTYTIELEKDSFNFDVLQIELTGPVLPPLQIVAKQG